MAQFSLSGLPWKSSQCQAKEYDIEFCLKQVQEICQSKRHLVVKVLRFTLDNYEKSLKENPNTVLIQLFRDPRAVMSSRSLTNWYHLNVTEIVGEAKCLCSRMYKDYMIGKELQAKYPGRFLFVIYEDLLTDVPQKLDRIFQSVGMDSIKQTSSRSEKYDALLPSYIKLKASGNTMPEDYMFKWRQSLKWDVIRQIDPYCSDIFKAIGYKAFHDEMQYKNKTVPSLQLVKTLKL